MFKFEHIELPLRTVIVPHSVSAPCCEINRPTSSYWRNCLVFRPGTQSRITDERRKWWSFTTTGFGQESGPCQKPRSCGVL